MELTMGQHYYWKGMRPTIQAFCKHCGVCKRTRKRNSKKGFVPVKANVEAIPWHTLCIDLIGPYKFGVKEEEVSLHCLTMIDPATGWFDICEIPSKRADYVANYLEMTWFSRYPWPTEIVMDRGKEFAKEVRELICTEYGIAKKLITTRNPQANSIVERVHKVVHQMIDSAEIKGKSDLDETFGFDGLLSAVRSAVRSVVHTTTRATPTQLVFGRDAILNVSFEADWQYIKQRKQKLIVQNNVKENAKRKPHEYSVGDKVMIRLDPQRKHGTDKMTGPHTLTAVNDNGTVTLRKDTNGGAVHETWNIRNLEPCVA